MVRQLRRRVGRPRATGSGKIRVILLPQGDSVKELKVTPGTSLRSIVEEAGFDAERVEARKGAILLNMDSYKPKADEQIVLLPEGKIEGAAC